MLEFTMILLVVLVGYMLYRTYKANQEICALDKDLIEAYEVIVYFEKKADKYAFLLPLLDEKTKRSFYNKYQHATTK